MPRLLHLFLFTVLAAGVSPTAPSSEPSSSEAIALAVVFDTSGSMRDPMPTGTGAEMDTKYRIAQRAFGAVIDRLETYSSTPGAKPLRVGIYTFDEGRAQVAVPFGPFRPAALRQWLSSLRPRGSTPLGDTLYLAATDLLQTSASARHVLVLTDGTNTAGRNPSAVLAQVGAAAQRRQAPVFVHVIALDMKPSVFAALEQQGATLIGAADGAQLAAQFDFILEEKILVEAPR